MRLEARRRSAAATALRLVRGTAAHSRRKQQSLQGPSSPPVRLSQRIARRGQPRRAISRPLEMDGAAKRAPPHDLGDDQGALVVKRARHEDSQLTPGARPQIKPQASLEQCGRDRRARSRCACAFACVFPVPLPCRPTRRRACRARSAPARCRHRSCCSQDMEIRYGPEVEQRRCAGTAPAIERALPRVSTAGLHHAFQP